MKRSDFDDAGFAFRFRFRGLGGGRGGLAFLGFPVVLKLFELGVEADPETIQTLALLTEFEYGLVAADSFGVGEGAAADLVFQRVGFVPVTSRTS